jgi:hypothetical protein
VAQTRITPDEVQAFPAAREENPCQPGANGMDPLHLTNEICKHGRGIVSSPRESEHQRHGQIDYGQDGNI